MTTFFSLNESPPSSNSILTPNFGANHRRINRKLDRLDLISQILTVVAGALFILSFVFLSLAHMEYLSAYTALFALGGSISTFFIIAAIHCCLVSTAKKGNLDYREDVFPIKHPPPEKQKWRKK